MEKSESSAGFQFPEFYNFPPFFTIQPTLSTQEKQLRLWKDLILTWHHHHKIYTLNPSEWPYFSNPGIPRSLSPEGKQKVIDYMIRTGNAEWQDDTRTRLRILWKTPEEIAAEFFDWICQRSMIGNVYTLYELTKGEEVEGTEFFGMEEGLFTQAIQVLEQQGKAQIFKGATSQEDGVKFFL